MKARFLVAAAALAVTLAGGAIAATAPDTWASSDGCAFTNGCATLHGFDAASHAVAMDAKYQNKNEILIGYPDLPGDGATSFDAVLHYANAGRGHALGTGRLYANGDSTAVLDSAGNPVLTAGTQHGTSAQVVVDHPAASAPSAAPSFTASAHGGGDPRWVIELHNGCYLFGYPDEGLPAGTEWAANPGGPQATDYAHALAYAQGCGSDDRVTAAFIAVDAGFPGVHVTLTGIQYGGHPLSFSRARGRTPYFTFVYAKGGVWSDRCVTDIGGSGALKLETCTLGRNRGQDFLALNAAGVPAGDLQHNTAGVYHIQNLAALAGGAADSCLTDPSQLVPGTPQADAVDEAAVPAGRQLRVDGSCSAAGNLWSWAS